MAAAGGAASIITQVQQGAAPPLQALGGRLHNLMEGNEADVIRCRRR